MMNTSPNATQQRRQRALKRDIDLINVFRKFSIQIPPQAILCFLHVAYHGEIEQSDLEVALGLSHSSISRTVDLLSKRTRHGSKGPNLLVKVKHPYDSRRNIVTLTSLGKALKKELEEKLWDISAGE